MKTHLTLDLGKDVISDETMCEMPDLAYATYIEEKLFCFDHYEVLRAIPGEYPIATTRAQIELLINYLQSVKARIPEDR